MTGAPCTRQPPAAAYVYPTFVPYPTCLHPQAHNKTPTNLNGRKPPTSSHHRRLPKRLCAWIDQTSHGVLFMRGTNALPLPLCQRLGTSAGRITANMDILARAQNCGDVLTKKKLDAHRGHCRGASFTCLDCMTHFRGTDYKAHTVRLPLRINATNIPSSPETYLTLAGFMRTTI